DVAEVLAVVVADLMDAPAHQLGDGLLQRRDGMLEDADLSFQRVEPLDVDAAEVRLEDLFLDRLELGLERVDGREVAVDDGVEERVEDERRDMPEQLRLALGPRANAEKAGVGAVADRQDEVGADEDIDLADAQPALGVRLD